MDLEVENSVNKTEIFLQASNEIGMPTSPLGEIYSV